VEVEIEVEEVEVDVDVEDIVVVLVVLNGKVFKSIISCVIGSGVFVGCVSEVFEVV
jgi:hypothetical protein